AAVLRRVTTAETEIEQVHRCGTAVSRMLMVTGQSPYSCRTVVHVHLDAGRPRHRASEID
ncbi:MAG TPA: hypothetical protein VN886_01160, partial [Acidimicrobiales bacterium]|nr:hypothetical protein [Acidimicrobiales bacterium]